MEQIDIIIKRINNVLFPDHWINDGVEPPNRACKDKTIEICRHLYYNYLLIPNRIASAKECGIYIAYINNDRTMVVEIFNDLDVCAIVNNNTTKQHTFCEIISNVDFNILIKDYLLDFYTTI